MWAIDPRVAWQVVGGQAVLLDLVSGNTVGLTDVGTFLWTRLEGKTDDELTTELVGAYDVDGVTARRDLTNFLSLLKGQGFLAESG
jgi:predicted deacylase